MSLIDTQLPAGWEWQHISDRYRITKKPRALMLANHETIPFVPMEAIPANGRTKIGYEIRNSSKITSGTYFERGDVLLSKITPSFENGKQGLAADFPTEFGFGSTEIIPLQPVDSNSLSLYLFYYLLHPEVRNLLAGKMEGSTGRQRVPEHAVRDFPLPMPPRIEQEKIVSLLWKIQKTIEIEEKLIKTTRELKISVMEKLFSYGLHNETQRESEVGLIPKSWTVLPLEEVREFLQYGTSSKCDYPQKGNPVIRIPNIVEGKVRIEDLKWCQLSNKEIDSWMLENGDVLFIRTNGVRERVGTCAVYHGEPKNALFASYLIRARLKADKLDSNFLQYYTSTALGTSFLGGRASPAADGKFNINTKSIDSVLVPLPKIGEQKEIVNILQMIDQKIEIHVRKKSTFTDFFETLLNQLMTGQIRVDEFDIDTSVITS